MSKQRIAFAMCVVLLLSLFRTGSTGAEGQGGRWSEPYRLSDKGVKASEASLVADQYGYVHSFWTETIESEQRTNIQYARFDGGTWSAPNDIFMTSRGIENISSVVDQHGTLHIVWTEGSNGVYGPAYYTYAPASNALSVQNWAHPLRIDIPAGIVRFRIDSKGVFHIIYINRTEDERGVYYIRSTDQGETWSEPIWLDPDILPAHTPDSLNFELDENDGLHAVWFYGALDRDGNADWVRYVHSLDGGETWSSPFMIDQFVEETGHNLASASPVMIVQGQTVHVIWAAGVQPYRHHRFSTDAGLTWSAPVQIFGELQGQAFDGLAVDGAGRVHFFGQIRYPFAIYEAYWDQTRWSQPSLVYFIATEGSEEGFGGRVHAHYTLPVVRAGNQLVLTFTDPPAEPNRRLFTMHWTLDDIAPLEALPTPTPMATLIPTPSPMPTQQEPMPTVMATADLINTAEDESLGEVPRADLAIQFGLIPVLLFLGGTLIFWIRYKNKP
jgi:hypothetical protein